MPPVQVIETEDAVSTMIRFQTSAVYETILSLQTLIQQRRRITWANQARTRLSSQFLDNVTDLFSKRTLMQYIELPVDYPNHDDVPGFIEYVRNMSPHDFAFYVTGRLLPPDQIAEIGPDPAGYVAAVEDIYGKENKICDVDELGIILNDTQRFQEHLTTLWDEYWNSYFAEFVPTLRSSWESGLAEAGRVLDARGTDALLEQLAGKSWHLPKREVPPGQPIDEVVYIPLYLIPHRALMFFGYGNVTILFDSEHTEARAAQIEAGKEEALNTVRALSDNTRLSVLRTIALHEGKINGKAIAAKLNLSASAVSRHLTQLRDGGLIVEEPLDHRNITYRIQRETIASLPDKILEYLYT